MHIHICPEEIQAGLTFWMWARMSIGHVYTTTLGRLINRIKQWRS